jgi:hypothetical protein
MQDSVDVVVVVAGYVKRQYVGRAVKAAAYNNCS